MSTTIQEQVEAPPVAEPVYPVYLRAAERLRGKPWKRCCGMNLGGAGSECIMNAVGNVTGNSVDPGPLGFATHDEAWAWNDHPDRTLSEVLERLTRSAYGEFER